jgi:release factor glutamine methyltransferase
MVNAKDLFNEGKKLLEENHIENSSLDCSFILKKHTGLSKADLLLKNPLIFDNQRVAFLEDIKKRAAHIPLQYILGEWEFMSLPFKVNENVLIPRADTEPLVEAVLKQQNARNVLDLCTGSGCIAIALAHYNKNINCIGIDISEKALEIANENAKLTAVDDRVKFIKADVLSGFHTICEENSIDIIVSNPPYINSNDINTLQKEVKDYEPILALDGGTDGFDFYKNIIPLWKNTLKKGGAMYFECGINQAEQIKKLFCENSFSDIEIIKDYNGIERVVWAKV